MASDLERLVAELRAIAGEVERLRPQLVQHAGDVRRFAAEVAADPLEQTAPRGHAVSLLDLAGRQCDALAAELGYAKQAADHFAQRVLSGGGGGGSAEAGSAGGSAGGGGTGVGGAAGVGGAEAADVVEEKPAGGRGRPGVAPPGAPARPGADEVAGGGRQGLPPYVPWWIPNGAPWLGNRGIAPRRDEDGKPLTRFSPADLSRPTASGGDRRGGHGGSDVPPSRVPVTDTSRDLVTRFVEAGYTSPNCLPQGLVDERSFWMDQAGHAVLRHAEIPDSALMRRALDGQDPITGTTTDWETGKTHKYSRDATSFTSRAALVFAEAQAWTNDEAVRKRELAGDGPRYVVSLPAKDVLGPDFARYIKGWTRWGSKKEPAGVRPTEFADDTVIKFIYRRQAPGGEWHPFTVYPVPQKEEP